MYSQAVLNVDSVSVDRRLRARLIWVSRDLVVQPQRRLSSVRWALVPVLVTLLLLSGGMVTIAAHMLPDDLPSDLQSLLSDHLPVGTRLLFTHAQAGIWLVSLPCTATASQRAGETTWHVSTDCPLPYNLQPQIPASVGSQARQDVLLIIAMQRYQDYWAAHPGWTAATAPQTDALARAAAAQALDDYLAGKAVTIRYAPINIVNGVEVMGTEQIRDAHAVERERAEAANGAH